MGETGSGKSTFATLLCRLADPVAGAVRVGGVDLRDVAPGAPPGDPPGPPGRLPLRRQPWPPTCWPAATATPRGRRRRGAFDALGLGWWVDRLPEGLATPVASGAATCRSASASSWRWPAPSSATRACSSSTRPPARSTPRPTEHSPTPWPGWPPGGPLVAIAHRLATAEAAELVLVFDGGRIVERGTHDALVGAGGTYARLYESWLGNTQDGTGQAGRYRRS